MFTELNLSSRKNPGLETSSVLQVWEVQCAWRCSTFWFFKECCFCSILPVWMGTNLVLFSSWKTFLLRFSLLGPRKYPQDSSTWFLRCWGQSDHCLDSALSRGGKYPAWVAFPFLLPSCSHGELLWLSQSFIEPSCSCLAIWMLSAA